MNRPTLVSGIVVALMIALAGAVCIPVIQSVFPWQFDVTIAIGLLALLYGGYLLSVAKLTVGRIVLTLIGVVMAAIPVVWHLPLAAMLSIQGLWVWSVRSICFQKTFYGTMLDGLLLGCGGVLGLAIAQWTQSWFLAIWSMLLIQSLFIYIPTTYSKVSERSAPEAGKNQFEQSFRMAESALKQIVLR